MALTPEQAAEVLIRAGMINFANRGRGVLVISHARMAYLTPDELPDLPGPFAEVRRRVQAYNPLTTVLIVADSPIGAPEAKVAEMPIPEAWQMNPPRGDK